MKTILVATDFSAAASNAATYAADMALSINADLMLLHVGQPPVNFIEIPVPVDINVWMKDNETEMNRLKENLLRRTNRKINITSEIAEGYFFQQLKNTCERLQPYAVVIGNQGKTAAEHLLFGSNAVNAMQHLQWPLITVPAGLQYSSIKKIGIAVDFNKTVEPVQIERIKVLVADFKAELHVLNTGKQEEFNPDIVFQSGRLRDMLGPYKPQYHFISNGNTDEGILNFAEQNKIDLLIVLPARHSLFSKLFHKSFTKQMILHSHLPVMALH